MSRKQDEAHDADQRAALTKRPPVTDGVSLCSDVTPAGLAELAAFAAFNRERIAAGGGAIVNLHVPKR